MKKLFHKTIALVLTVAVILSCLVTSTVFTTSAEDTTGVYTGEAVFDFSDASQVGNAFPSTGDATYAVTIEDETLHITTPKTWQTARVRFPFELEAGKSYVLSFKYKVTVAGNYRTQVMAGKQSSDYGSWTIFGGNSESNNKLATAMDKALTPSDSWSELTVNFVADENIITDEYKYLGLYIQPSVAGEIYIDDVVISEAGEFDFSSDSQVGNAYSADITDEALRMYATSGSQSRARLLYTLENEKVYKISLKYKAGVAASYDFRFYAAKASTTYGSWGIFGGDSGESSQLISKAFSQSLSADGEWVTAEYVISPGCVTEEYKYLGLWMQPAYDDKTTTCELYIDDVVVTKMGGEADDTTSVLPIIIDFEETYINTSGAEYYSGSANKASDSWRGSHSEIITESDGNTAMRLTYDAQNNNYKDNAAFNIYDPSTKSKFVGKAGTTYVISFDYKIECTDDKTMQLYIATCGRASLGGSDLNANATAMATSDYKFTSATSVITETTDGYISAVAPYTANGTDYPIILLSTNNSTKDTTHDGTRPYASVLIDNVTISENKQTSIPCYNYDGNDGTLYIYPYTTFGDLELPLRKGYIFDGWYTDAELTDKADDDELVCNYNAVYVKWSGDGTAMTPTPVDDVLDFSAVKACSFTSTAYDFDALGATLTRNINTEQVGAANVSSWRGEYVYSAENIILNNDKAVVADGIRISTPCHSAIFYVELPDFEKAGETYALSLGTRGLCMRVDNSDGSVSWYWFKAKADGTSTFAYMSGQKWNTSTISADGALTGLPSGYKGYIRIDFDQLSGDIDLENTNYTFNSIEFEPNAFGGECGNFVLGGIVYIPYSRSESTVWRIKNTINSSSGTYNYFYYDMAVSDEAVGVNSYDVYSDSYYFATRYSGTAAEPAVKLVQTDTSAFWANAPVGVTSLSGEKETTSGYMTTYSNAETAIRLQPGVDTFMFYVELPEFTPSTINAPLKLLDTTLSQSGTTMTLSFSNSAYEYAGIYDGAWNRARAGADGDLKDIPSGFKGFIKFCVKDFKNINDVSYYTSDGTLNGIDLSKPYSITKFELGFNNVGGENGELVIGGIYSVILDSEKPFLKNGITSEKLCFKVIPGDFDCDGTYNAEDIVQIRKAILNIDSELSAAAELRRENLNLKALVRAKKVSAGVLAMDVSADKNNVTEYKEIFSADIGTTDGAVVYEKVYTDPNNYQVIAQDYEAYQEKGDKFAAEILANQIGTFEKTGIDKMCHVSTFLYSHGNIYMSYYANTISASENPTYQVARLAYAPEDNPTEKVIIDIMQVGDELYGKKITGVYDTILMQKQDEPDNLYILWTAAVNGEYYRLYQVFNMATEELGPIGVNRFKVNDTVNDFSRAGMKKALNNEGIGYKQFDSDIGIMQKLSTREENGETYYYTGAYCCDFTCIIKSKDLITWEYVAQPNEGANGTGFENCTRWENAVYVLDDKVYYYVRQWDPLGVASNGSATTSTVNRTQNGSYYGILTAYDLITGEWETPILVEDCQSRSDFIMYQGNLYLFYAPTPDSGESDRQHIGILKINTEDLAKTEVVLQAKMGHSCFYPFIQYNSDGELCMSYTVNRKQIRLASFTLSGYLD